MLTHNAIYVHIPQDIGHMTLIMIGRLKFLDAPDFCHTFFFFQGLFPKEGKAIRRKIEMREQQTLPQILEILGVEATGRHAVLSKSMVGMALLQRTSLGLSTRFTEIRDGMGSNERQRKFGLLLVRESQRLGQVGLRP